MLEGDSRITIILEGSGTSWNVGDMEIYVGQERGRRDRRGNGKRKEGKKRKKKYGVSNHDITPSLDCCFHASVALATLGFPVYVVISVHIPVAPVSIARLGSHIGTVHLVVILVGIGD